MRNRQHMYQILKRIINSRSRMFAFVILSAITDAQELQLQARQREQMSSLPKALPSALRNQAQALGTRARAGDKEETAFDAQLVDDVGNKKSIHIVYQVSGLVRIEGIRDKTAVTFDGEFTHGVADRRDESLLDTFLLDTPEGMFYSLRRGASMVLLGHDLQPESRTESDFKGPRYDVYLVTAPDRIRKGGGTLQSRRFYFDSTTGLLASTRYVDSAGVNIETRFLRWEYVDASAYPGTVERYENGRLTFSITANTVTGQPKRNAATFQ